MCTSMQHLPSAQCRACRGPTPTLNPTNPWGVSRAPQFKGDITELEELRELKEDVGRREAAQATLIQSQVSSW
jgi:hypothetical protein